MAQYILDKAYKVTDSGGVLANRVVVQATNAGESKLPGAAGSSREVWMITPLR